MKRSVTHLLGATAIAALLAIAACDQNENDNAAVPAEDGMGTESTMPDAGQVPGNDMTMGEESAAEGTDADTIAGTGDAPASGCAAVADALSVWTGKPYADSKDEFSKGEGVATVRVIHEGDAVTQDFNAERLNIELDADENVTKIYCG
ncbi:MAG: hypothetical protein K9G30_08470 [Parvibaculum sp.]|nr:hypothetical protein [Parvibaculum sp.]